MGKDVYDHILSNPNQLQTSAMSGILKGIVIDVRDPAMTGRVRVYIFANQGHLVNIDAQAVPWCERGHGMRGFVSSELGDRVLVSFEASDKSAPIVVGNWYACPMGGDKTLWSSKTGSEVPPEAWRYHDLYPEVNVVIMSGAGNGIWTEDKLIGQNLASVIQLNDTGDKIVKASSFHLGCQGYAPFQKYDGGIGKMLNQSGSTKRVRDGVTAADKVAGEIELSHHNITRLMTTDKDTYSLDQMLQNDDQGSPNVCQESMNGQMHRTRQETNSMSMVDGLLALNAEAISALSFYQPPRIW